MDPTKRTQVIQETNNHHRHLPHPQMLSMQFQQTVIFERICSVPSIDARQRHKNVFRPIFQTQCLPIYAFSTTISQSSYSECLCLALWSKKKVFPFHQSNPLI